MGGCGCLRSAIAKDAGRRSTRHRHLIGQSLHDPRQKQLDFFLSKEYFSIMDGKRREPLS